jgi:hypothetical protein
MTLNEMLRIRGFDLRQVLVMRHRPSEPGLNRILPWLATERPDFFNAYQQTQGPKEERAMEKAEFVASFIRHGPGKALFIGLYKITGHRPLTREHFWEVPAYIEMKKFGMKGFTGEGEGRDFVLWFDLELLPDFYPDWKGKLVVGWPKPDRAWCRRAHEPHNTFPVLAVAEDSVLDAGMPRWDDLVLGWEDLALLPSGRRSCRSGGGFTTSSTRQSARATSAPPTEKPTYSAGGRPMRTAGTAGIRFSAAVTPNISCFPSFNGSRRMRTATMLSDSNPVGRRGFTPATRSA